MTQEEKFEEAKRLYKTANADQRYVLELLFPELKESEEEKIIKAQLDYWRSVGGKEWHGVPVQETIAWLEKQGEHKSTDISIKEKAHQIAWETSKHYDPLLSKESWCEMAALDMASWLEKQARSTTITIPEDLKGTDTDGGVKGEKGEEGKA